MLEAELFGVQHEPRRAQAFAAVVSHVDFFAEQGVPGFRKVNANLVRAPRLEAAADEAGAAERLEQLDVGDRFLPGRGQVRRAAQAVAAVGDDARLNGLGAHRAVGQGQVAPLYRVGAKLVGEVPLGRERAGEHEQAAGTLVDSMHDAYPALGRAAAGARLSVELHAHNLVERAPLARIIGHRADAARLAHDHELPIDVNEANLVGSLSAGRRARRVGAQLERVAGA